MAISLTPQGRKASARVLCLAALAVAASVSGAAAKGCLSEKAGVAATELQRFLSSPEDLLRQYPDGGWGLSTRVKDLAASDVGTVAPLLEILGHAGPAQVSVIGDGLARAAAICISVQPATSELIQLAVAKSGNAPLVTAFLESVREVETAALAIGGGVAAGKTNFIDTEVPQRGEFGGAFVPLSKRGNVTYSFPTAVEEVSPSR